MPSLGLAFVGATRDVSPWLLPSLARVGRLDAICGEEAERDAAKFHARWVFSDPAVLLREAEPAGVVLHGPLADRPRLIKQCLAAGAGVLVIGAPGTAAACKRLATFSKLSGRFVLAAPAIRFAPAVLLARRLVESGKLGRPISMTLHSTRRGSPRTGADDHGVVPSDQAFEAVDLVQHLIGPVQQAFAVAHEAGVLVASLTAASGIPVSLVLHASGPAEAVGVEIEIRAAEGARLYLDRNLQLSCGNGSRVEAAHRVSFTTADPAVESGHEGLLAAFRHHLLAGRSGLGLIGPVATCTAAVEAIFASAARRRPVVPKQVRGPAPSPLADSVGAAG